MIWLRSVVLVPLSDPGPYVGAETFVRGGRGAAAHIPEGGVNHANRDGHREHSSLGFTTTVNMMSNIDQLSRKRHPKGNTTISAPICTHA